MELVHGHNSARASQSQVLAGAVRNFPENMFLVYYRVRVASHVSGAE